MDDVVAVGFVSPLRLEHMRVAFFLMHVVLCRIACGAAHVVDHHRLVEQFGFVYRVIQSTGGCIESTARVAGRHHFDAAGGVGRLRAGADQQPGDEKD